MDDEKFYTTAEAAKELGLSQYTIRKKIREGEIRASKQSLKEGYFIPRSSLEKYRKEHPRSFAGAIATATTASMGLGLAAGIVPQALFRGLPVLGLATVVGEQVAKILTDKNTMDKDRNKELLSLKKQQLEREAKAHQYDIETLEIKGGDNLTQEDKLKILDLKKKINNIESVILEIKMREIEMSRE